MQFRTLSLKHEEGSLFPLIPSHFQTRNYQELPQEVSTSLNFQFCACQSGEWISGQKAKEVWLLRQGGVRLHLHSAGAASIPLVNLAEKIEDRA